MITFSPQGAWASRPPVFLFFFCFLLFLSNPASAQTAPTLIPFQARLTTQAGDAYSSGQYTLTFNLYDQAVGGSTVWTERHEKVGIVYGMVNVFLGSIATFPTWQPGTNPQVPLFTGTKYLGITVDADGNAATADPEMVPRTMLVNAFHAQNASNLAGYNWSAILQSGLNDPQNGFIRADKLNPASITSAQLAPSSVTSDRIADNAIISTKLADGSIASTKIASNSITTDKLADNSVTPSKIAPSSVGQFAVPAGGFALSQPSPTETALVKAGTSTINELEISLYSTGRPIELGLCPGTNGVADDIYFSGNPKAHLLIKFFRQELDPQTNQPTGLETFIGNSETYVEAATISYPSGCYKCFDTTAIKGKLYKYYLKFITGYADTQVTVTVVRLYAHDL